MKKSRYTEEQIIGLLLKAMEDENRRLKLLVAELSLHGEALAERVLSPAVRNAFQRTTILSNDFRGCNHIV